MNIVSATFKDSASIVLCGEAGQGIQTVEYLLTRMAKHSGFNVFSTKEYMSRIRGGNNSTEIRISSEPVSAYVDTIDILIPLSKDAISHVKKRISKKTIILGDQKNLKEAPANNMIDVPFSELTHEIGDKIYLNTLAIGLIAAVCKIQKRTLTEHIKWFFSSKNKDIIDKNIMAAVKG